MNPPITAYLTSAALAEQLNQSQRTAQRVLKEQLGAAVGWRKVAPTEQASLFGTLNNESSPRKYGLRRRRKRRKQNDPAQTSLF